MFDLGVTYCVTMLEPGDDRDLDQVTSYNMVVVEEALPIVRFEQFGKPIIINISSARFVKAEPQT